ncbi:MAG TPA: hypothetical protein VK483_16410 [Chitinophagaceae bacterium]|nr:hypothetical protein [Chitinophagaceae bacterium]
MNRLLFLLLTFSFLIFNSCNSNEIGSSKDVNPEAIYFDYKIWGDEGNDNLTVRLQYRFGGKNGTTLTMEKPARVELDDELLPVDSTKMTGAFYEIHKPINKFNGEHTITFTDFNEKQYREKFRFQPLQLKTGLPDTLKREKMLLEVDGLDGEHFVRVILSDTSFTSEGINRVDTIKNGQIIITEEDLGRLVNGPIQLELIKEEERLVKNGTREGGKFSISYGLKREFFLKD